MARDLTSGMVTALTGDPVAPIFIMLFDFDSGPVRGWTGGAGELSWDGETWIGGGDQLSLAPAEETLSLAAAGASFTLSGIPSELIAIALDEDYQERPATMWLGALDLTVDPPTLIADPYEILTARMDVMDIDEGPETSRITLTVENRLVDLEVAKQERYTPEDQKRKFAGDTLFDQVAALQDAEVVWSAGS